MLDLQQQQALSSLAGTDPLQLCQEAKTPSGLYEQCVSAGLLIISGGAGRGYGAEEVARLHALFDVALANGLASLVSHYVTEVCMDPTVVSSDAIESKLLDGSIVQSWATKKLQALLGELRETYGKSGTQSDSDYTVLSSIADRLRGLRHVLDALQSSIGEGNTSAEAHLRDLKETLLKALQHLEVFSWCSQHHWLEHLPSVHATPSAWVATFERRREAAAERSWPIGAEPRSHFSEANGCLNDESESESSALFVEDALQHLNLEQDSEERGEQSEAASWLQSLAEDASGTSGRGDMEVEQNGQLYPPKSVRAAVDALFLRGWASELLAKKAIFLYYLYDRFWGLRDERWQGLIREYCAAFSLPDFFHIECLVFFLLDNDSNDALQEACRLLTQIAGPKLHPRISQVLLERGAPREALNMLRASARLLTKGADSLPLDDIVTALRASLECGPLSEAYVFQHNHWAGLQEALDFPKAGAQAAEPLEDRDWAQELAVTVSEVVRFAVRKNVLKEMVELPWTSEEEGPLERALISSAQIDLGKAAGSHLVVYYLLRCRYAEAMIRHRDVCRLEDSFQENNESRRRQLTMQREQRTNIVEASYRLLPEAQRHLIEQQLSDPPPQPANPQHKAPGPPTLLALPAPSDSPFFSQAAALFKPAPFQTNASELNEQQREKEIDDSRKTGDGDAEFSPQPRRLLYEETDGVNSLEDEEDELTFHSPLGRFTPEGKKPLHQNGTAEKLDGNPETSFVWNKLSTADERGANNAAGGPFMSPIGVKRVQQQTPAAKRPSFLSNGGAREEPNGAGGEREGRVDGLSQHPPQGNLYEEAELAEFDDEPIQAGPRTPASFSFKGFADGPPAYASPSFHLPEPPLTSDAGRTPAFLRNGGPMRWRAEDEMEDGLLDEAVESALTPGVKRPKASASAGRSKKTLRHGML